MPFQKGMKRPEGAGRKPGQQNRDGRLAKEAIQAVFDKLGGVEGMVKWADKNEQTRGLFYSRIYTRILPHQVDLDPSTGIRDLLQALKGQ